MEKVILIILFSLATWMQAQVAEVQASDEVLIAATAIVMPTGRIVLVRKGSEYCAIKFIEAWTGKTVEDRYAKYESYYQGNGTGDFSNKDVQSRKEQLCARRFIGFMRFGFRAGFENLNVKCGSTRLLCAGKGSVHFCGLGQKDRDYGIELAPTKWTDISQVNVFDKRLQWYRYDENRKDMYIPIDQVWKDGEDQK